MELEELPEAPAPRVIQSTAWSLFSDHMQFSVTREDLGQEVCFRVIRQPEGASFAPGQVVLSVRKGRQGLFTGAAFVQASGVYPFGSAEPWARAWSGIFDLVVLQGHRVVTVAGQPVTFSWEELPT